MTRTSLKKILAREWLTLIVGLLVGFLVVPSFLYTFGPDVSLIDFYIEVLGSLFGYEGSRSMLITMAVLLAPYFVYQFARSVLWAIKAVREI